MKRLYVRFALSFLLVTSLVIVSATILIVTQTHIHFLEYQEQAKDMSLNLTLFDYHFEQAIIQTILWTSLIGLILIALLTLLVSKWITKPLIEMKKIAAQMAKGDLGIRLTVKGQDEVAELGHSLNDLAEQLKTQERLRKEMTADIAHELRTPLAILKSHLEAMRDGVWTAGSDRLASCCEDVNRLHYIVGDLEQLTALEAPDFKLQIAEENLPDIISGVARSIQNRMTAKNISFQQDVPERFSVQTDRRRFEQILMNLLTNAVNYTPEGGSIHLKVNLLDDSYMIQIQDTGAGIDEADLPHIFERFYRANKARGRLTGGSGLGLTIVQRLVQRHGGSITVSSIRNIGTTFTLTFPVHTTDTAHTRNE